LTALLLHNADPMPKAGLSALVEGQGLKPAELHQLRLLSERLLDDLADGLSAIAGKPAKISNLKPEVLASADFWAKPETAYFTVLAFGGEPSVFLKIDLALACAIVRSALGADISDLASPGASLILTAMESRVLARAVPEVLSAAVQRVFGGSLAAGNEPRLLFSCEGARAPLESFKSSDQIAVTSVECALAGASANLSCAIPLPVLSRSRAALAPARFEKRLGDPEPEKIRKALASARIELSAVLGSVAMSLGEIRSLEPGSVVLLQKLSDDVPQIAMRCGERTLFSGTVIEDGGWYRFLVQPVRG
jgi:flagellar motor switch protein FliM